MNNLFFQITDGTMKMRRNLLFTASLAYLHFWLEKLEELKVLNVQFDNTLLDIVIPITVLWFLFNYLTQFYAEYTQWRIGELNKAIKNHNITNNDWKGRTINTSIKELSDDKIRLEASFSTGTHAPNAKFLTDTNLENKINDLMKNIDKQIRGAIEADVHRVDAFHSALSKFNVANRFRFHVLDLWLPILYSIVSILPLLPFIQTGK